MSYKDCPSPAMSSEASTDVPKYVLLRPGMDRILENLKTRHRRLLLLLLKDGLVESKSDVMVRDESNAEAVEAKLVHNHLPKLEEAGYIEWDRATDEISKGPRFEEIEPLLELIETHADELPPEWP